MRVCIYTHVNKTRYNNMYVSYVIYNTCTYVYIKRFPCELSSFSNEGGYLQPGFEGISL